MIHSPASFSRQLSAWNEAKLYTNTFGTQRCCMKLRSMASQLVSSAYVFEVFLLGIRSLVSVQWTPKYMFSWTENFLSSILKTSRICNRIKTFKEQPCFCFNFRNSVSPEQGTKVYNQVKAGQQHFWSTTPRDKRLWLCTSNCIFTWVFPFDGISSLLYVVPRQYPLTQVASNTN